MTDAERLAKLFHETYERLAPQFGYKTRKESAVPWEQVPENNRRLMIAVCDEILQGARQTTAASIYDLNAAAEHELMRIDLSGWPGDWYESGVTV